MWAVGTGGLEGLEEGLDVRGGEAVARSYCTGARAAAVAAPPITGRLAEPRDLNAFAFVDTKQVHPKSYSIPRLVSVVIYALTQLDLFISLRHPLYNDRVRTSFPWSLQGPLVASFDPPLCFNRFPADFIVRSFKFYAVSPHGL